jgi:hypothetical protein
MSTFALALVAVAYAVWRLRQHPRAEEPLRLYEMIRLRGVPQPSDASDVAAAELRCADCASKEMCDELLASGATEGYRRFCPNAIYLEWLRSNSLRFD